ncbi:MAG: helix-turn-helix domain-containing protein [Sulfobacillus sp.]
MLEVRWYLHPPTVRTVRHRGPTLAQKGSIIMKTITLTEQIDGLIQRHQMSDAQAAEYLGVPISTIRNWRYGRREPSASAKRLVEILLMLETLAPGIHDSLVPPAVAARS